MTNIPRYDNFSDAVAAAKLYLALNGYDIHTEKWQGMNISQIPQREMFEVMNYSFSTPIWTEELQELQEDINPHLPWAEDHFWERVGGLPINPGEQYKNWPYYINRANDTSRCSKIGQYNHNYMERIWPKWADLPRVLWNNPHHTLQGIRFRYGDLNDVIDLLEREPQTRQAFIPIWFPEDTGVVHGGRVPCTIGYQLFVRHDKMHIVYPIRSCDFFRHFQDDIYLAVRLVIWILNQLRDRDVRWLQVKPGNLTMHITSLHVFSYEKPNIMRALENEPHKSTP